MNITSYAQNRQRDSLLLMLDTTKTPRIAAQIHHELAKLYIDLQIDSCIIHTNKALRLYQEANDSSRLCNLFSLLGEAYFYADKLDRALESFKNQEIVGRALKDTADLAGAINNQGIIYRNLGQNDKAIEYYTKALALKEIVANKATVASTYNNIGVLYQEEKNYLSAKYHYKKAYELSLQTTDTSGRYNYLINLAEIEMYLGNNKKAGEMAKVALSKCKEKNYLMLQKYALAILYETSSKQKNYEKAYAYHKEYSIIKDSIFKSEAADRVNELNIQYETEKKNKEIKLLNKEKQLQKLEIDKQNEILKQQRIILFLGIVTVLFILLFLFFVARQNRRRKKINHLLSEKNKKITSQYEEIQTQSEQILQKNAEIEVQRDFAEEQRDLIMKQNKNITDSIHSALRIQNALLTDEHFFEQYFAEHFIFYLPKDIVSGDFYWMKKVREYVVLAAADSTGHGVPGAFMSMLGISFLNEIVNNREITSVSEVLNLMRVQVIQSINQNSKRSFSKEGIDMALIAINQETNVLQFAGAYNGVIILRENKVFELKGDRMPIGLYFRENDFTTHQFQLQKGDNIYLYSDGFLDQFGGKNNRKYLYRNFVKFLKTISPRTMEEQKIALEKEYLQWKNTNQQIDDLLVMGIKW